MKKVGSNLLEKDVKISYRNQEKDSTITVFFSQDTFIYSTNVDGLMKSLVHEHQPETVEINIHQDPSLIPPI